MDDLIVREERAEDIEAVRKLNESAFDTRSEADLVDSLRERGNAVLSLVAVLDGAVVGHILFSRIELECSTTPPVMPLGLAPMAVDPKFHRQGIGSRLVEVGLVECHRLGSEVLVVLGHPDFYPRFGFTPASKFDIRSVYDVPDEVFMALELREGALDNCSGVARYAEEFGLVSS